MEIQKWKLENGKSKMENRKCVRVRVGASLRKLAAAGAAASRDDLGKGRRRRCYIEMIWHGSGVTPLLRKTSGVAEAIGGVNCVRAGSREKRVDRRVWVSFRLRD